MSKLAARLIVRISTTKAVLLNLTENLWGFPQVILDSGVDPLEQIVLWAKKEPQVVWLGTNPQTATITTMFM